MPSKRRPRAALLLPRSASSSIAAQDRTELRESVLGLHRPKGPRQPPRACACATSLLNVSQEALKLLRPAADQGDATAQLKLGVMYRFGIGVSKDVAEAAKLFRSAADQGNAAA